MKLSELAAANEATIRSLAEKPGRRPEDHIERPYYGYYDVDLFECPPFLMFTGNDCPRAADILYNRQFEPLSMKLWCRLARNATGILDIGAHVGVYSLAAAKLRPDLAIHAFEPNPMGYARLRMHKLINRFDNIVEHWFAVGNKSKFVEFSWVRKPTLQISSGGGVGARSGKGIEKIVVPMHKIDGSGLTETLGNRPLVKIDVEGGEVATVQGLSEVLALTPDVILETFNQSACDAINAVIQPLGYRVYHIMEYEDRLVARGKLEPCNTVDGNFNQLLTVRPHEEIEALLRAPAQFTVAGPT